MDAPQQPDSWNIDVNWKMKKKRAFMRALKEVGDTLDESALYPFFADAVKAWPHPLDPANVESYDELTTVQFDEVARRTQEAFRALSAPAV